MCCGSLVHHVLHLVLPLDHHPLQHLQHVVLHLGRHLQAGLLTKETLLEAGMVWVNISSDHLCSISVNISIKPCCHRGLYEVLCLPQGQLLHQPPVLLQQVLLVVAEQGGVLDRIALKGRTHSSAMCSCPAGNISVGNFLPDSLSLSLKDVSATILCSVLW